MPAITPARIDFSDPLAPRAMDFDDVYHSRAGAAQQARHVFLQGNDLPRRWQGRSRFVILETGFGLGNNFLATAQAWRDDPQRCQRLWFVSIEKHPPTAEDLATAHGLAAGTGDSTQTLAAQLVAAWPAPVSGLHLIDMDGGRIRLLLAFGEVSEMLRELVLRADAFFLDGFAPSRNAAMWDWRVWRALPRLAAPDATAATWSVARTVLDGLGSAGFAVDKAPGFAGKYAMTVARFSPRHTAAMPLGRRAALAGRAPTQEGNRVPSALIVGAGLAGASAAHALAREGWQCTVIEAASTPASGASGNRAGLFHGLVNGTEGPHARLLRAAALHLVRHIGPWLHDGRVPGQSQGLLRAEFGGGIDADSMAAPWPPALAQALSSAQSSALTGVSVQVPAWCCRAGGWLDPRALVQAWLADAKASVITGARVERLARVGDAWQALGAAGQVIAQADVVVLANAADVARLAGSSARWPLRESRGQLTDISAALVTRHGVPRPSLPVAGSGYLATLPDGSVMVGATSEADESCADTQLRPADHLANLAQVKRLVGDFGAIDPQALGGRVGWRCATDDRLPLIGPVPAVALGLAALPHKAADQPRHVQRAPGLYVLGALGSRGITLAPLAGEVLAAWITGAPMPIEASLMDAVDAARFVAQSARSA